MYYIGTLQETIADVDHVVPLLNSLIETCKDAELSLASLAIRLESRSQRDFLSVLQAQRRQFSVELQALVRRAGGQPVTHGSAAGALRRNWMELKATLTGDQASGILIACQHADNLALKAYQHALRTALPVEIETTLRRHYEAILEACADLDNLCKAAHVAA